MARSKPTAVPDAHAPPVTWDEFIELDDEDRRELIDGVLVEVGSDGRYTIAQSLADDAVFEPESFPGLSIPLSELWVEKK